MQKMKRSQWITFLDTTPSETNATYSKLGIGITELAIAYNPSVESEKWIIDDNARHSHNSNEKQASVSQTIYTDDPCYTFVNAGRDKLDYATHILDVDMSKKNVDGSYYAELSDGLIAVTNYMGANAQIEYDLYYEGDKTVGTVTITSGVPTFTPSVNASL